MLKFKFKVKVKFKDKLIIYDHATPTRHLADGFTHFGTWESWRTDKIKLGSLTPGMPLNGSDQVAMIK